MNKATSSLIAQRLVPDELPGRWGKTLEVPAGQLAVSAGDDEVKTLEGARHKFGGLGGTHPPRDVALLQDGPFSLHPAVSGLLSQDDELLTAYFLVQLQISDPVGFYTAVLSGRDQVTRAELTGQVEAEVQAKLLSLARQWTAADLCAAGPATQTIAGELRSFLTTSLTGLGLEVRSVSHLSFLRAEDALERDRKMRDLRQALRSTEVRERLQAAQTEADFWDALQQIAHEKGLKEALRKEDWGSLRVEVFGESSSADFASPATPAGPEAGRRLEKVLDQRANDADPPGKTTGRLDALMRRLGAVEEEEQALVDGYGDRLRRWIALMRVLLMVIIFATYLMSFYIPQAFPDSRVPEIITTGIGVLLAVLAYLSTVWLHGKVRAHIRSQREARKAAKLGPQRRQAEERLLRDKLADALGRVEANLEKAWQRAYRSEYQAKATAVRRLAREARNLRDEVRTTGYQYAQLVAAPDVDPARYQELLTTDVAVLAQADQLVDSSLKLYNQAVERAGETIDAGARQVEIALQALRDRYEQRRSLLRS